MEHPHTHDALSPHASPSQMSKKLGVRRVNNLPLYLVGGVGVLFLLVMASVAMERAEQARAEAVPTNEPPGDVSSLATAVAGNRTGGFVPAVGAEEVANPVSFAVPIALPEDMEKPPLPPRLKETAQMDPDADRIHQEKMQLFENAVRSKTAVSFTDTRPTRVNPEETLQRLGDAQQRIAAIQKNDPNTHFQARLAQLQHKDMVPAEESAPKSVSGDKADRWQMDTQVDAPRTPYTLRAGFVIPATLISGINSELPGQIIGQISQDVYDTATGKYLLLPQGSRLVGTYTADVAYGQSRVMVAWQRIVFPDGKTLDIGAMPGADGGGYAGFNDQTNNHYLRIFGSALLMSGITAGTSLSQNNSASGIYAQPSASAAMSEALGQQLGTVSAQMISKNLSISPTLEIRPGFRFNVMCVKDLVLDKPYAAFDYSQGEQS